MIKAFCDACQAEINNPNFYCEGTVMEVKEGFDLTSKNLNAQRQAQKRMFHLCQKCYNDNFAKLLK